MEAFIKEIGLVVEPKLANETNNRLVSQHMSQILPTIKQWIEELFELRSLKTAIC